MSSMPSPPRSPPPAPPPVEPLINDPAELTPDLEDDIDLSTLRFLTGTLRHTFLPYLGWIIAFTSFAKLTRFFSPYLFRGTRWTADWTFWAFEKTIQFVAWGSMWAGMAAVGVWTLLGVGLGVAWFALKVKPTWKKAVRERPVLTKVSATLLAQGICWRITRRILGAWAGKLVLVLSLGWTALLVLRISPKVSSKRQTPSPATKTPTTQSSPKPPNNSSDGLGKEEEETEMEEEGEEEMAEKWARSVRAEMLRESLLSRGKSNGVLDEDGSNVEAVPADGETRGEGDEVE